MTRCCCFVFVFGNVLIHKSLDSCLRETEVQGALAKCFSHRYTDNIASFCTCIPVWDTDRSNLLTMHYRDIQMPWKYNRIFHNHMSNSFGREWCKLMDTESIVIYFTSSAFIFSLVVEVIVKAKVTRNQWANR